MSAKTYAFAAGSAQRIKKVFVSDSGSVVRRIKKIYASDSGGVTRLVYVSDDELSMLVGNVGNNNGYINGTIGTLTPTVLGDGATVQELLFSNHSAPVPGNCIFEIDTYPGTITSSYLTSLNVNGNILTPSSPNFTGFSGGSPGGAAQWSWSGAGFPTIGSTIPVIVTRT
jgi:hypothetical protein